MKTHCDPLTDSQISAGQPTSRGVQAPAEDADGEAKGSRGPRRVRREDREETSKGSRQARRWVFSFEYFRQRVSGRAFSQSRRSREVERDAQNSSALYNILFFMLRLPFQTNWASTRTDTSRWPTRWTRRSPNWQDIRSLVIVSLRFLPNDTNFFILFFLFFFFVFFFLGRGSRKFFTFARRRRPARGGIKKCAADIARRVTHVRYILCN